MDNGLVEKGSKDQKLYYIGEQLEMQRNFANLDLFYKLLQNSTEVIGKEDLLKFSNEFYEKNLAELKKADWLGEELQKKKSAHLNRQNMLFERYINVNMR